MMRRSGYRRPTRRVVSVPRRTTLKRQAFGNFASAMQQRDSTNVVISSQEDVTMYVPTGATNATLVRNVNAILTSTQYFKNYMGMYDQYKINAVRASLEMISIGNRILNSARFPSICTAWDRNGIKVDTVNTNTDVAPVYKYTLPDYGIVSSYSSANEKTIYYGSRWGVIRQLDAASMMEKSIYLPTSHTRDVLSTGNMYSAWNPMLLIGVKIPGPIESEDNCVISIHWQFDVTLRGLRKVNNDTIDNFIPFSGFIGYAPTNKGIYVRLPDGTYQPASAFIPGSEPSINPDTRYDATTGTYINTGIVVPNNGMPGVQNLNP